MRSPAVFDPDVVQLPECAMLVSSTSRDVGTPESNNVLIVIVRAVSIASARGFYLTKMNLAGNEAPVAPDMSVYNLPESLRVVL